MQKELKTHSGRISDVRKSPTGGKAGRGSEGCVEVREVAALERKESGTALRLGSDQLLSRVMIVRKEGQKNN
jgi:hypothetical protein